MKDVSEDHAPRQHWLGLMAKAPTGRVATLLDEIGARPAFTWLRAPEVGSTMVRARAGATGSPFNLGEVTVTRCALSLATGEVGHAYIQGRNKADAEAVAVVDALMQTKAATTLQSQVLDVLDAEQAAKRDARAAKARYDSHGHRRCPASASFPGDGRYTAHPMRSRHPSASGRCAGLRRGSGVGRLSHGRVGCWAVSLHVRSGGLGRSYAA